jgi:hypothetical protein
MLTAARDMVGRVALIVFFVGLGEFIIGLIAVMSLFQTVGAIGHARGLLSYAQAIGATAMILLVASLTMNGLLAIGIWVVQAVTVE